MEEKIGTPSAEAASGGAVAPVGSKHRPLEFGEIIQAGDEVWAFGTGPWEAAECIGNTYSPDGFTDGRMHYKHRRPLVPGLPEAPPRGPSDPLLGAGDLEYRPIEEEELRARFEKLRAENFVVRNLCDQCGYDMEGLLDDMAQRNPKLHGEILAKLQIKEVTIYVDTASSKLEAPNAAA